MMMRNVLMTVHSKQIVLPVHITFREQLVQHWMIVRVAIVRPINGLLPELLPVRMMAKQMPMTVAIPNISLLEPPIRQTMVFVQTVRSQTQPNTQPLHVVILLQIEQQIRYLAIVPHLEQANMCLQCVPMEILPMLEPTHRLLLVPRVLLENI
tara:strand:+ start:5190 stop:5648 length:459 start_codon:yes stop_codon:yes gene_type:complete